MKVMKFGGRTLGSPERIKQALSIIAAGNGPRVVVLSALAGTTQALKEIAEALLQNRRSNVRNSVKKMETFYREFVNAAITEHDIRTKTLALVADHFTFLNFLLKVSVSEALKKDILTQGEVLSTILLSACMQQAGIDHQVVSALDFMQTDKYGEPLIGSIKVKLTQLLNQHPQTNIFITQGAHCRNVNGELHTLSRGGSDYTASSIAAAMNAEVCEIWTDINVLQNNDPSIVDGTAAVEKLSFEEAAEAAYFGEKILHPASIWPARHYSIPVNVLNTQQSAAKGTMITDDAEMTGAKIIASRDEIIMINIKSSRMLMAYGFMEKILQVFEKYHTSIDMVTTAEVAVSVTIDNRTQLPLIAKELEAFGVVTIQEDLTMINIVGQELLIGDDTMGKIFTAFKNIPLQMISYGGGRHNISLLIASRYKGKALQALHQELFAV